MRELLCEETRPHGATRLPPLRAQEGTMSTAEIIAKLRRIHRWLESGPRYSSPNASGLLDDLITELEEE